MRRRALLQGFVVALGPSRVFPADRSMTGGEDDVVVFLGALPVRLVQTVREPPGLSYVSVHENEQTAVTAARRIVERRGGRLIELRAQRQRLVTFSLDSVRHTFDPNRMFTEAGIEKTLRRYGPYTKGAHAAVAGLAAAVLRTVRHTSGLPLVAVHNNTEGGLSVESYRPGGPLHADAAEVWVNRGSDADDFFLVTERPIFEGLRKLSFNVVLQHSTPTDDGSLSVYCQGRVPYVNVEARFGHLTEQVRMLEAVYAVVTARA